MRAPFLSTALWICLAGSAEAAGPDLAAAQKAYQRTDYRTVIAQLSSAEPKSREVWQLLGQAHYQTGEYNKAIAAFEKAVAAAPSSSESALWLGRAFGRKAEHGSPLTAPRNAVKARQAFEKALELDGSSRDALGDLFEYYLNAPGFLGGGVDKAAALVDRIARLDSAEGHFARAQLADKRKDYATAEAEFRKAVAAAPKQPGRLVDLARFLARRGHTAESDTAFADAARLTSPPSPQVAFARAETLIEQKRNLAEARTLLEKYIASNLTPDDPPRSRAQELLKATKGS